MLISVSQWAAQEHITTQAANKRIRDHGIPRHGKKIDPDEAKRIFSATVDVRQQERGTAAKHRPAATATGRSSAPQGISAKRSEIQTAIDAVKLKRQQNALKREEGKLVDAEQVKSATEARFRADAEALLNWPARVAADLAVELGSDERATHAALDKYVREFMRERSMVSANA